MAEWVGCAGCAFKSSRRGTTAHGELIILLPLASSCSNRQKGAPAWMALSLPAELFLLSAMQIYLCMVDLRDG
jgi:hypothetical protein